MKPRRRRALFVLLLFLLLPAATTCSRESRKNLVLITVDTLRPDHLGYGGYHRSLSPELDALAAEGQVFRNAYSQSGWTLPSLASLHTGMYPRRHGAVDLHLAVDPDLPTLAGILSRAGYRTSAFVSLILLNAVYGLDKGFSRYDFSVVEAGNPEKTVTSPRLTDLALEELENGPEPFFLWIHYFDPHWDYLSHPGWEHLGDDDVDLYDQEIAFTSRHIGRLLSALEERGLRDRTLVVFTADHGEEFGEHGGEYHYTVFNEVLRIPLILAGPGIKPGPTDAPAQHIDILPTVLNYLGVPHQRETPGTDLLGKDGNDRPLFFSRDRPPGFQQGGVILGNRKLVHIETSDLSRVPAMSRREYSEVRNVVPGTYLYDLAGDPGETRNLFHPGEGESVHLMELLIDHFRSAVPPGRELPLSEEEREQLRSLGYVN